MKAGRLLTAALLTVAVAGVAAFSWSGIVDVTPSLKPYRVRQPNAPVSLPSPTPSPPPSEIDQEARRILDMLESLTATRDEVAELRRNIEQYYRTIHQREKEGKS